MAYGVWRAASAPVPTSTRTAATSKATSNRRRRGTSQSVRIAGLLSASMCANCVTGFEALAINGLALATGASSLWERITSKEAREVVRRRVYNENARWLASFGLDPDLVLGPLPETVDIPPETADPVPVNAERLQELVST